MKTIVLTLTLIMVQSAVSATLFLSGTVPDRGYTVSSKTSNQQTLVPNEGSILKVFVANLNQSQRGPASVGNSKNTVWTVLTGPKKLTVSSYVRVEAP